jgi:hypothetical protein
MAKHFQVDTNGTLTINLASYWPMEGNSNDFFGSNNGTDASITYGTSFGKVNKGAESNVNNSSKITVSSVTPDAVSLWVNPTSGHNGLILSDTGIVKIFYYGTTGVLHLEDGTNSHSFGALTTGAWNHIVLNYVSGQYVVYVNGSLVGSYTNAQIPVVKLAETSSNNSTTYLDEVGFWTGGKTLSSQEISDLYNGGSGQTMVANTAYTKTLSDSILNGASRTASIARIAGFLRAPSDAILNGASRTATVSRLAGFSRSVSDSILNGASRLALLGKGVARTMSDSIMNGVSRFASVSYIHGWVRAMSDSILNGASRTATVSRLGAFGRNMSDSILNGASRTATLAKGLARAISDSIGNAASRFASVARQAGFLRTISDSILNGASRTAALTKGLSKNLSDSVMNAASRLATLTRVQGFIRTISDSMMVARGRLTIMKAYVNGLLIQFKSKFTPQGTSFNSKYVKQNTDFENKYQ